MGIPANHPAIQKAIEKGLLTQAQIDAAPVAKLPPKPRPAKLAAVGSTHQTEEEFMQDVAKFAREHGWMVFHVRPAMVRDGKFVTAIQFDGKGFPDLLMLRERQVVAELKSDKGRITDEQRQWIGAFVRAGGEIHLWRPKDWDVIRKVLI